MFKKMFMIMVLIIALAVLVTPSLFADNVDIYDGGVAQRFFGTTNGAAMTFQFIGTQSTGCSVTFSTTGITFYKNGVVDSSIGSAGVLLYASVDDTDEVHTLAGIKRAVNEAWFRQTSNREQYRWDAQYVDGADGDSPAVMFDTDTLSTAATASKVYFKGLSTLSTTAIGEETRSYDQIRVTVPSGTKVRLEYCYASVTAGRIYIYDKNKNELWRSPASATPSLDTLHSMYFTDDFIVKVMTTNDVIFTTNNYLQIWYVRVGK